MYAGSGTVEIMLNIAFRPWLIGGWMASIAVIVALSVSMGANLSTSALFLALGVAPGIMMLFLERNGPTASVAEILHSVDTKDGRL